MIKVERTTEGFNAKVDEYPLANSTTRDDDYLLIHQGEKVIAQYVPGAWAVAWMEEDV